jgi:hypothetical protein
MADVLVFDLKIVDGRFIGDMPLSEIARLMARALRWAERQKTRR